MTLPRVLLISTLVLAFAASAHAQCPKTVVGGKCCPGAKVNSPCGVRKNCLAYAGNCGSTCQSTSTGLVCTACGGINQRCCPGLFPGGSCASSCGAAAEVNCKYGGTCTTPMAGSTTPMCRKCGQVIGGPCCPGAKVNQICKTSNLLSPGVPVGTCQSSGGVLRCASCNKIGGPCCFGQPFGSKCENGGQCYGAEGEAEGEAEGGSKTGSALTCFAPAPEGEAEGGR